MICPKCQSDLAVMRSMSSSEWECRDLKCLKCGHLATSLTMLLGRRQDKPLGSTARTMIQWAERGKFEEARRRAAERLARPDPDQTT